MSLIFHEHIEMFKWVATKLDPNQLGTKFFANTLS